MAGGIAFVSHGLTHVGRVRRRNEDAFLDRSDRGIWVVADGMGGHQAGDVASAAIVAALGAIEPPPALDEFADLAATGMSMVSVALENRAAELSRSAVIASTVVMLLASGDAAMVLWAGDSRAYRLRAGGIERLTIDHSRVQEMVDAGHLTPEQAARHPMSNIVTRAVGTGPMELDRRNHAVLPQDRFLLCSDGVTNMLDDSEIEHHLAAGSPQEAAERMCDLVLERGAIDNLTIVIVDAIAG